MNERVITAEDGQSMAEILGVRFFETSAMLENSNVDDIFAFIISKLADKEPYCTYNLVVYIDYRGMPDVPW